MKIEGLNLQETADTNPDLQKNTQLERIKKYLRIATIIGVASFAGKEAVIGVKHEVDYKKYFNAISSDREKGYAEMRTRLVELIGEKAVQSLEQNDKKAFVERREGKRHPLTLNGFEKLGLDNKELKEIWNENNGAYPKSWIDGEISEIAYDDKGKEMPESYGQRLEGREAAGSYLQRSIKFYGLPGGLKVSDLSKDEIIMFLDSTFAHEISHANDWKEDQNMEINERQSLLLKIVERAQSEKPFKSALDTFFGDPSYSGEIQNTDKQKELQIKVREYWADICEEYFQNAEWLQENYPLDFKIVDDFVKQRDPTFNPTTSGEMRRLLYKK